MVIGAAGIVVNELGQVLLIRRNDTRTLAPPGGSLELNELPPDGASREVREETGMIVLPVRLVGLYFQPRPGAEDLLLFYFRCLIRGGELTPSEESPQVGFFPTNPLPGGMLALHRQRIRQSLTHYGGPPHWQEQQNSLSLRLGWLLLRRLIYPLLNLNRRLRRRPPYQPPPYWHLAVSVIVQDEAGQVLWLKQGAQWVLPSAARQPRSSPWQTAVWLLQHQVGLTIQLTNLTGIYTTADTPHMTLTFTATIDSGTPIPTLETAYFSPGQEPDTCCLPHQEQVADAFAPGDQPVYRLLPPT